VDFETMTAPHRRELLAHCYRMCGSVHDAEDLLQETLLRAWRAFATYDAGKASMRTWLYRIATNVCLSALKGSTRRPLPSGLVAALDDPLAPMALGAEVPWLQPFPADPAEAAAARGSLRLAFIAAMQLLPARQRAILILRDVLDWPAAQVAEALGTTAVAVNSGLRRARATLGDAGLREDDVDEPPGVRERAVVEQYVAAFLAADLGALRRLLVADVVLEMPPVLNWYTGRDAYVRFIARSYAMRGIDWRAVPISANGQAGVAAYVRGDDGCHRAHTLQIFDTAGDAVTRLVVFQEPSLFTAFGLPLVLNAER
jgi:RNA polymerase sigma-70 factor (ECF subfamily)